MSTEIAQIQVRRDSASNWTSHNPTLADGEFGKESDTGKLKIGDGSTTWTSLSYIGGGSPVEQVNVVAASGTAVTIPDPGVSPYYTMNDITLTANCTLTPATAGRGKSTLLLLTQGGAGSFTPTITGVKWPGNATPPWSTAVGKQDAISLVCVDGVHWLAFPGGMTF